MSLQNAFLGSLVADAVAMPVHWYYNRQSLDYGDFPVTANRKHSSRQHFMAKQIYPKSPMRTFLVTKQNIGDKKELVINFGRRRQYAKSSVGC